MRPVFATATGDEGRFRTDVAAAVAKCFARGEDIELGTARLVLTAPDGTRYYLRATNAGLVASTDIATDADAADPATAADLTALTTRVTTLEDSPIRLRAHRATSAQALTVGATTTLVFNAEDEDADAAYDPATGIFTAPVAGDYEIVVNVAVVFTSGATTAWVGISQNGASVAVQGMPVYGTDTCYGSVKAMLPLAAGDTIIAQVAIASGTTPVLAAQPWCNISIRKH